MIEQWRHLPSRTRGLAASTAIATALAVLTLLQQQVSDGVIDWTAVGRVGVSTLLAGLLAFVHGLRQPQE